MTDDETAAGPTVRRGSLAAVLAGAVLFAALLLLPAPDGMPPSAWRVAALAALMATWWITEAVPVYATALLPIVLLPALGVLPVGDATAPFANPLVFLFMGGFLIALAMQRWGLHRRIALSLLRLTGTGARALVGGFMLAAGMLSMWVSNTATAIMMLPIGISVAGLMAGRMAAADEEGFGRALLLGIAYGASIGGIATLVGTPPNALLAGYFSAAFDVRIGFAEWLAATLPLSAVMLLLGWVVLTRVAFRVPAARVAGADALIDGELAALGPMSRGERIAAFAFVAAAVLWTGRPLLADRWPGVVPSDAEIAMGVALILFVAPVEPRRGIFALDWATARGLPWGVLILFGGGLSLATSVQSSGLADWIGAALSGLDGWPVWALVLAVVAAVVFLTELTSNTATTAALLPVLASTAVGLGENPLLLAAPAALAASCAFMMPVATPPNAIVFGAGRLTVADMARAGFWLNLAAIILIVVYAHVALPMFFDVEVGVLPSWGSR